MIEKQVDIPTRAGSMDTFICHPERRGPWPGIIFYMDAPGIREELRDMARRLATAGYYVLLPNLYYRAGRGTALDQSALTEGSPERERMWGLLRSLSSELVAEDTQSLLAFIDRQDSPHLLAPRIKGEIYFACAETDKYAPLPLIDKLKSELERAGTNFEIEIFPGTEHGFAFPQRHCYHKTAAETHWERLFDLFGRRLR